jgi:hypothetical protein
MELLDYATNNKGKVGLGLLIVAIIGVVIYLLVNKYGSEGLAPTPEEQIKKDIENVNKGIFLSEGQKDQNISRVGYPVSSGLNLEDMDYQEAIQRMAVSDDVAQSHKLYAEDPHRTALTASLQSEFEPVDTIPFVGLRRPNYNVPVGPGARTVPSEYVDQLPVSTPYMI